MHTPCSLNSSSRIQWIQEAGIQWIQEARIQWIQEAWIQWTPEARIQWTWKARIQWTREARIQWIQEARSQWIQEARIHWIQEARGASFWRLLENSHKAVLRKRILIRRCVLPRPHSDKESAFQCRRLRIWHRFDSWVRKIPWSRKRQPTPVVLPGESHGQRSLVGYSPDVAKSRIQLGMQADT